MSAITLADAQAQLTAWLAASTAVAGGQSYTIGDRTLTRADAAAILKMVTFWENKVNALTRGSSTRSRLATPIA